MQTAKGALLATTFCYHLSPTNHNGKAASSPHKFDDIKNYRTTPDTYTRAPLCIVPSLLEKFNSYMPISMFHSTTHCC